MKRLLFYCTLLFLIPSLALPSISQDNSDIFSNFLDHTTTTRDDFVGSSSDNDYFSNNSFDNNNSSSNTSYPSVSMESLESGCSNSDTYDTYVEISATYYETSNNNQSANVSSSNGNNTSSSHGYEIISDPYPLNNQTYDQSSSIPSSNETQRHFQDPSKYSEAIQQQKRGQWIQNDLTKKDLEHGPRFDFENIHQTIESKKGLNNVPEIIAYTNKKFLREAFHNSNDTESKELAALGYSYVKEAFEEYEDEDWETCSTSLLRMESIKTTLKNNWSQHKKHYPIFTESKFCLEKFGLGHHNFPPWFYGNDVQHQLYGELVDVLKDTAELHDAFATNFHISSVTSVIVYTVEHARICNKAQLFKQGFALSDFANRMLDVGRSFAHMIMQGFDVTLEIAKSAGKGVLQGTENFVESWKEILTNPLNAGLLAASLYSPQVAVVVASVALCKVAFTFCKDYKAIAQYIADQPQDCITGVFSFATTVLLSSKIDGALISQLGKLKSLKTFSKIVKQEQALVANFAQEGKEIKDALKPIARLTKRSNKFLLENVNSSPKQIASIIKQGAKDPNIILLEEKIAKGIDLVSINNNFTKHAKDHILLGKYTTLEEALKSGRNPGLMSGLHTFDAFEIFLKKCNFTQSDFKIEVLQNGVARLKFPPYAFTNRITRSRNMTKLIDGTKIPCAKTFWPASYTEDKILKSSLEIIRNLKNYVGGGCCEGISSDNIKSRIRLNGLGEIITSFPCWEQ